MFLSEIDVRAALTYEALIPAIRAALIDYSAGLVEQPARTILRGGNATDWRNGWFAVMPVVHGDVMGVKTVTFYAGNVEVGLPTHMAVVELLRRATGEPLAVMDGRLITEMRTAAVSAVALQALSPLHFPEPPRSLGILGSGVQARAHLQAFRRAWPELCEVKIWSRTAAHADRLADEVGGHATPIEEAAAAEVVLTATSAQTPILEGRWLRDDALVISVGATAATMGELDLETMRTCFLVAESRECVARESGDVRNSGAMIQAEIGETLANPAVVAIPRGRVLFKSVGMAVEDLAAARLVWEARSRHADL
jgi:ornithine cyclodeaminase/alanine dehydrogenase-like protein (mu-crystallin family)